MNRALIYTWLLEGPCPLLAQWLDLLTTGPLASWTLPPVLIAPLLGPGVFVMEHRSEEGRAGQSARTDVPWSMAKLQKGRPPPAPREELPFSCPVPESLSSSPKNHLEDHNIYHELYYGRLFFMFKNKRWLTELYLVHGSRLHVNVLKGHCFI